MTTAAASLFWTKGYAATSLADISAQSGVPLGNIYYYFRSKTALAEAVADIFVAETQQMVDQIAADHDDPRHRMRALVEKLQRSMRSRVENGCPLSLCIRDFRREHRPASDRAAESFTILIASLARELGRTGVRPSQGLAIARAAISEWQGGIALAHALGDAAILSESFRRMEQILHLPGRT